MYVFAYNININIYWGYKMEDLTLYEIMGEDMYLIANKVSDTKVKVEVLSEQEESLFNEVTHIHAWEGLVSFAKKILEADKYISGNK